MNGLSDRTPFEHSITIPQTASLPRTLIGECVCYYIKPELHSLGMIKKKTTIGNEVRCYDPERTICDLLRSRNRLDEEMVISAMKKYAAYKEKDLNKLGFYAEKFRITSILKKYLEVLLAFLQ